MNEYQSVILLGALVAGFVPVTIIVVFCLLTGRTMALFSRNSEEQLNSSSFIRFMGRLYLVLLPVYFTLLCVYAVLNLSGAG
ncbi:hypothetical protein RA29_17945 [Tateyamaria sp. ANG-S1]|nr:hypothetical protein RA29_17945 [Tateyamaria sp. ANG-S1]